MTIIKTIAKNTGVLLFAHVIISILSLIFAIYIARYLGDVSFGKYSFAFSFAGLFIVLSDLGLSIITTREVARDKSHAEKYLGNIAILKFILSILVIFLVFIIINLMNYPHDTTLIVYIAVIAIIFESFITFFASIYRAFEKMEYEAFVLTLEKSLVVGLGVSVLVLGYGLIEVVYTHLFASIIGVSLAFLFLIRRFAKPKLEIDFDLWKHAIKEAIPFGFAGILITIYLQIDITMLSMMKGDAVVGWYSAASRLVYGFGFIPVAFMGAIFPVMSNFFKSSINSIKFSYEKSFKYLLCIILPVAVGVTILADKIVFIIYGKEFVNSIIALQILIWVMTFLFFTQLFATVLGAINKQICITKIAVATVIANVALNLLLIPEFSYIGAAFASIISGAVDFELHFYFVSKHLSRLPIQKMIAKPIVCSLVMGVFIFYLKELNLIILIIISTTIYIGLLYLLRVFSQEDIILFKKVFRKASQDNIGNE
jgi:O-antigen/teichoic acid export membrane protein